MKKKTLQELEREIVAFVKEYGKGYKLQTFHLCADNGIEIQGSTIDAIEVYCCRVLFVYNENKKGDFDYLEVFKIEDLMNFFESIKKAVLIEKITSEVEGQRHVYFESDYCPFATIGDRPNTDYDEIEYGDSGLRVHEEQGEWLPLDFDTEISNEGLEEMYKAVIYALD